jgi:membrane associated rhomboid family serine protease
MIYPADLFSIRAYTLITSGFMHASWEHLLGNMLALFIFGRVVEKKLGYAKTALIYFGALIISGVFSSLIDLYITGSTTPSLGASGAIMGLVAAAILIDPFYITFDLIIPLPIMIVGWITIYSDISGIISPVADDIGHFAHLGGFLSVGVLLFLFERDERQKFKKGLIINVISIIILGAAYYFFFR